MGAYSPMAESQLLIEKNHGNVRERGKKELAVVSGYVLEGGALKDYQKIAEQRKPIAALQEEHDKKIGEFIDTMESKPRQLKALHEKLGEIISEAQKGKDVSEKILEHGFDEGGLNPKKPDLDVAEDMLEQIRREMEESVENHAALQAIHNAKAPHTPYHAWLKDTLGNDPDVVKSLGIRPAREIGEAETDRWDRRVALLAGIPMTHHAIPIEGGKAVSHYERYSGKHVKLPLTQDPIENYVAFHTGMVPEKCKAAVTYLLRNDPEHREVFYAAKNLDPAKLATKEGVEELHRLVAERKNNPPAAYPKRRR